MTWVHPVLCCCVLVLLAGCAGLTTESSPQSASDDLLTPAPVPTDEPPDIGEIGIDSTGVDVTRLSMAHDRTLRGESHSTTLDRHVEAANGTTLESSSTTAAVDADRTQVVQRTDSADSYTLRTVWSNDSVVLQRTDENDSSIRPVMATPTSARNSALLPGWPMASVLSEADASPVRISDGYRVTATANDDVPFLPRGFEAESSTVTAVIDDRGVIHTFGIRAEGRMNGEAATAEVRITVEGFGETSVAKPSWVDRQ